VLLVGLDERGELVLGPLGVLAGRAEQQGEHELGLSRLHVAPCLTPHVTRLRACSRGGASPIGAMPTRHRGWWPQIQFAFAVADRAG
jgi:hypothetical protein